MQTPTRRLARLSPLVLFVAVATLVHQANAQAWTWAPVATGGPNYLHGTAAAYDSARARTVLFGGYRNAAVGDTWEWDGTTWTLVATTGPSARRWHAMAFDSARGRTVLFGGYDNAPLGDTWEWDGTAWALVATTGPGPQVSHAMAFDSARGRTVLFGNSGDTWEWDGIAWTQVATTGPEARNTAAMSFDSRRGRTVLFGGPSVLHPADTWEWDGTNWTRVSTNGPARYQHAMVYDAVRQRTLLFGGNGLSGGQLGDTWEWDGVAWSEQATIASPDPYYGHAMAFDAARGQVVLCGAYMTWTATSLPYQLPCTQFVTGAQSPSVNMACQCNGDHGGNQLNQLGNGRINSTLQLYFGNSIGTLKALLIGLPTSPPLPIPPAAVACRSTGAPVSVLYLNPILSAFTTSQTLTYWLYLPNTPSLVGVTLATQGFEQQQGFGNPPFWPTQMVGLTILP